MANDWFRFKQFMIRQDKTAMKVGTDGVLLGAWAGNGTPGLILDIGTGTGLIALMMAQKFPEAHIDAVEIDRNAATQASQNLLASPWYDRLNVYQQDFLQFAGGHENTYDLVVSNPPYFNRSMKAPADNRTMARHDDFLPRDLMLKHVTGVLKPDGQFAMILPYDIADESTEMAGAYGLFPHKRLNVRPVPGKPYARTLVSFGFSKMNTIAEELIIETGGRHGYSEEYIALTKDFYLAF